MKCGKPGLKTGLLEIGKNIGLDCWRNVLNDCNPADSTRCNKKLKLRFYGLRGLHV